MQIQHLVNNSHLYFSDVVYTTNPHERSASNGRAVSERPPSEIAHWPLGRRLVVAHQVLGRPLARQLLPSARGD